MSGESPGWSSRARDSFFLFARGPDRGKPPWKRPAPGQVAAPPDHAPPAPLVELEHTHVTGDLAVDAALVGRRRRAVRGRVEIKAERVAHQRNRHEMNRWMASLAWS